MSVTPPIVMGITGASGAPYAVRLLQSLVAARQKVQLIVSSHGLRLLKTETDIDSIDALRKSVGDEQLWDSSVTVFSNDDRGAPPASGSASSRAAPDGAIRGLGSNEHRLGAG